MSQNTKAHLALFITALIYGANYTIAKDVMVNEYIQPSGFVLLRVIAGVFLFSFFHATFIKEKIERKDIFRLIVCGICGVATNQLMFFEGLKLTSQINASLIMTTTPILVLITSSIIIKEKITLQKLFGIALGLSGAILLILYGKKFAYHKSGMLGDALIFINATSYGLYLVLVRKLMRKYHPITVVKWIFIFGIIFVAPFGANDLIQVQWNTFTQGTWLAIAYVLICTTFLTYLFNAFALKIVNPSVVSIYIYLQPLLATLIALLLAKDVLTIWKVIAGILIFLGVFFVSKPQKA